MHFCTFKFPTSIEKFARITNYKCLNTSLSTCLFFPRSNIAKTGLRLFRDEQINVTRMFHTWAWIGRDIIGWHACACVGVPQEGNAPFHRYCSRLTATDSRIKLKLYLINSSRARYAVTCWGVRRWGRNLPSRPPAWSTISSDYCLQDFLDCCIVICQFRGVEYTIER